MNDALFRGLLRIYPKVWRNRYGEELRTLIKESRADRPRARIVSNLLATGLIERFRSVGIVGRRLSFQDRTMDGVLRVLWGWIFFLVGGIGIAKGSEYWSNALPASLRGLPSNAYRTLVWASLIGGGLVVLGITMASGKLLTFLRNGGWPKVKTPILRALLLTLIATGALSAIAYWAHRLSFAQRNGTNHRYGAAILCFIFLFLGALIAWAVAATQIARAISMPRRLLSFEAILSVAVAASMVVMTIAVAVWWIALAHDAPWYFADTAPGSEGTTLPLNILTESILLIGGSSLGYSGAREAITRIRGWTKT